MELLPLVGAMTTEEPHDPATARKRARDEAWRSSPDGALMRAIMGG